MESKLEEPTISECSNEYLTNFQKVKQFNTIFGVLDPETKINQDVIKENPRFINDCMNLVREEINETEEAILNNEFPEFIDGIADSIYVLYGMAARVGVDMDEVFDEVHYSNMSKICKTEEEAKTTVESYQGHKTYQDVYYTKVINDDTIFYVVKDRVLNKVLKSINWKPFDIKKFIERRINLPTI